MGLSKKDLKLITDPLADNNPITIQVLGICSALAITAELKASIVMSIAVLFVMGLGNLTISLMRNIIPPKIKKNDNKQEKKEVKKIQKSEKKKTS